MEQLLASLEKWFDPHLLGELLLDWTGKVLAALAIFVIGRIVAHWASRWLVAASQRLSQRETTRPITKIASAATARPVQSSSNCPST